MLNYVDKGHLVVELRSYSLLRARRRRIAAHCGWASITVLVMPGRGLLNAHGPFIHL